MTTQDTITQVQVYMADRHCELPSKHDLALAVLVLNAALDREMAESNRLHAPQPAQQEPCKRCASYKILVAGLEGQLSHHRAQETKYSEAINTLESERAANAALSAEQPTKQEPATTVAIPIAAGKHIAKTYGYDQVVIVARKVGGPEHVTTYGRDAAHCAVAARMGDFFKHKLMGWPEPNPAPLRELSDAWLIQTALKYGKGGAFNPVSYARAVLKVAREGTT